MDEDSYQDVVVSDFSSGTIQIYKNNNGGGTFTNLMAISVTGGISKFNSFTIGTFDTDSRPDIAISSNSNLWIYKNLGSLNFSLVTTVALSGYSNQPTNIKTADLNNDQLDDIILCAPKITAINGMRVAMFRNAFTVPSFYSFVEDYSQQIFVTAPTLTAAPGSTVNMDIAHGDFDGDAKPDVVASYTEKKDSVFFFKNLSAGGGSLSFLPLAARSPTILQTYSVTVRNVNMKDLNKDGMDDVVLLTSAFNGTNYIVGFSMILGANVFTSNPVLYQSVLTGISPASLPSDFKLADMNGDGFKDFVGISDGKLWLYKWDPKPNATHILGHFTEAPENVIVDLPLGSATADEIQVGDFDNNLMPDIFYKPWRFNSGRINLIPNYSYPVKILAPKRQICPGLTASLVAKANLPVVNPTFQWYKDDVAIVATGDSIHAASAAGVYSVHLSFPFPSTNGTCLLKSDSVIMYSQPGPTISIAGNTLACPGTAATLSATQGGTNTVNFTWLASGNTTVSTFPTVVTAPVTGPAEYVLIGKDVITGCTASLSTFVNASPSNPNSIIVSQSPICPGDSARLSFSSASSWTWTENNMTSVLGNDSVLYVKPTAPRDFWLFFTDFNGCQWQKLGHVGVDDQCEIKIFNAVSNNKDNNNDVWMIQNIARFPDNHVVIFNRWGEKVYDQKGYDNVTKFWPPKNNNLDPSTYYYVLDLGNGSKKIKGWIELIQ